MDSRKSKSKHKSVTRSRHHSKKKRELEELDEILGLSPPPVTKSQIQQLCAPPTEEKQLKTKSKIEKIEKQVQQEILYTVYNNENQQQNSHCDEISVDSGWVRLSNDINAESRVIEEESGTRTPLGLQREEGEEQDSGVVDNLTSEQKRKLKKKERKKKKKEQLKNSCLTKEGVDEKEQEVIEQQHIQIQYVPANKVKMPEVLLTGAPTLPQLQQDLPVFESTTKTNKQQDRRNQIQAEAKGLSASPLRPLPALQIAEQEHVDEQQEGQQPVPVPRECFQSVQMDQQLTIAPEQKIGKLPEQIPMKHEVQEVVYQSEQPETTPYAPVLPKSLQQDLNKFDLHQQQVHKDFKADPVSDHWQQQPEEQKQDQEQHHHKSTESYYSDESAVKQLQMMETNNLNRMHSLFSLEAVNALTVRENLRVNTEDAERSEPRSSSLKDSRDDINADTSQFGIDQSKGSQVNQDSSKSKEGHSSSFTGNPYVQEERKDQQSEVVTPIPAPAVLQIIPAARVEEINIKQQVQYETPSKIIVPQRREELRQGDSGVSRLQSPSLYLKKDTPMVEQRKYTITIISGGKKIMNSAQRLDSERSSQSVIQSSQQQPKLEYSQYSNVRQSTYTSSRVYSHQQQASQIVTQQIHNKVTLEQQHTLLQTVPNYLNQRPISLDRSIPQRPELVKINIEEVAYSTQPDSLALSNRPSIKPNIDLKSVDYLNYGLQQRPFIIAPLMIIPTDPSIDVISQLVLSRKVSPVMPVLSAIEEQVSKLQKYLSSSPVSASPAKVLTQDKLEVKARLNEDALHRQVSFKISRPQNEEQRGSNSLSIQNVHTPYIVNRQSPVRLASSRQKTSSLSNKFQEGSSSNSQSPGTLDGLSQIPAPFENKFLEPYSKSSPNKNSVRAEDSSSITEQLRIPSAKSRLSQLNSVVSDNHGKQSLAPKEVRVTQHSINRFSPVIDKKVTVETQVESMTPIEIQPIIGSPVFVENKPYQIPLPVSNTHISPKKLSYLRVTTEPIAQAPIEVHELQPPTRKVIKLFGKKNSQLRQPFNKKAGPEDSKFRLPESFFRPAALPATNSYTTNKRSVVVITKPQPIAAQVVVQANQQQPSRSIHLLNSRPVIRHYQTPKAISSSQDHLRKHKSGFQGQTKLNHTHVVDSVFARQNMTAEKKKSVKITPLHPKQVATYLDAQSRSLTPKETRLQNNNNRQAINLPGRGIAKNFTIVIKTNELKKNQIASKHIKTEISQTVGANNHYGSPVRMLESQHNPVVQRITAVNDQETRNKMGMSGYNKSMSLEKPYDLNSNSSQPRRKGLTLWNDNLVEFKHSRRKTSKSPERQQQIFGFKANEDRITHSRSHTMTDFREEKRPVDNTPPRQVIESRTINWSQHKESIINTLQQSAERRSRKKIFQRNKTVSDSSPSPQKSYIRESRKAGIKLTHEKKKPQNIFVVQHS